MLEEGNKRVLAGKIMIGRGENGIGPQVHCAWMGMEHAAFVIAGQLR